MQSIIKHLTLRSYIPTLNEYIKVERTRRIGAILASKLKREVEANLMGEMLSQGIGKFKNVKLYYMWYRTSRREDKDNIAYGQKFVQDSLVKIGVIKNDGWKEIEGFEHDFDVDVKFPRLVLTIAGSK
jgi:hypothetical protein